MNLSWVLQHSDKKALSSWSVVKTLVPALSVRCCGVTNRDSVSLPKIYCSRNIKLS